MRGGSGWTYGVGARSQILIDGMSTLNPKKMCIRDRFIPFLPSLEPLMAGIPNFGPMQIGRAHV